MKTDNYKDKDHNANMNLDMTEPDMPQVDKNNKPKEKKCTAWREVISGGLTGILLGSTSVFLSGSTPSGGDQPYATSPNKPDNGDDEPVSDDTHVTVQGLPVAHVSDDMSFSEAFASARAEVGAGGIFEWRGGVYGTYYKDEWDAMTDEQKQEYASHINYSGSTGSQSSSTQTEQQEESVHDPKIEEEVHDSQSEQPLNQDNPQDADIEVLGVGELHLDDGSSLIAGQAIINDQDVLLVDTTGDIYFDTMVGPNGIQALETPISVAEFESMNTTDNPQNNYLADSDYQNDGNVEEFYGGV